MVYMQCAICLTPLRRKKEIQVDHDHVTEEARGVLCRHCNLGLGHFFDNPLFLRRAASYLDKQGKYIHRTGFTVEQVMKMTSLNEKELAAITRQDKLRAFYSEPDGMRLWDKESVRNWLKRRFHKENLDTYTA